MGPSRFMIAFFVMIRGAMSLRYLIVVLGSLLMHITGHCV